MENGFLLHILVDSGHKGGYSEKGIGKTSLFHVLGFSDGELRIDQWYG